MYRILIAVILLIVYGSLYPWQFHPAHQAGSPFWILIHSWPARIDRFIIGDVVVNLVLYMPLGLFGSLALDRHGHQRLRIVGPVLLGWVLSSSIEITQLYDSIRNTSMLDVICNVLGTCLGVAMALSFRDSLARGLARQESSAALNPSGPLLLIYGWLACELFPLFPVLSRTRLSLKLHALLASHGMGKLDVISSFAAWLTVGTLLEAVFGERRSRKLLFFMSAVVPAQLFVADRQPLWGEAAGTVAALIVWACWRKRSSWSYGLLAAMLLGVVALRGLTPFVWSTVPGHFSWLPFGGFLRAQTEASALIFLQKCFYYGAAIWLIRAAGRRMLAATALVAAVLAAIEVAQIYVPGHTPEITDPVLAILLGAGLWLVEQHRGAASGAENSEYPQLITH